MTHQRSCTHLSHNCSVFSEFLRTLREKSTFMPYVVQDNLACSYLWPHLLLFSFQPCCSHISLLTLQQPHQPCACLRTFAHADPSAGTLFPSYSIVSSLPSGLAQRPPAQWDLLRALWWQCRFLTLHVYIQAPFSAFINSLALSTTILYLFNLFPIRI